MEPRCVRDPRVAEGSCRLGRSPGSAGTGGGPAADASREFPGDAGGMREPCVAFQNLSPVSYWILAIE